MNFFKKSKLLYSIVILLAACGTGKKISNTNYIPDDPELYRTIAQQDSIFF
jgi:hypothetical protein